MLVYGVNFVMHYHRDTLMSIAKHYQTGKVLPEDIYSKLLASRTFRAGSLSLRQVSEMLPLFLAIVVIVSSLCIYVAYRLIKRLILIVN